MKKDLEKAKTMIELIKENIRNRELSDTLIDGINDYLFDDKSKIKVGNNCFYAKNKKSKDEFSFSITPSIDNIESITINKTEYNRKFNYNLTALFDDDLVKIYINRKHCYVNYETEKLCSIETFTDDFIYKDNLLMYKRHNEFDMDASNNDSKAIEAVTYINKERFGVEKEVTISLENRLDDNIGYYETALYDTPVFNDKDACNSLFMYGMKKSNEDCYLFIKDEVESLINKKNIVKVIKENRK